MAKGSDRRGPRSLAMVASGEQVVITRILGRGAVELCRSLGLREGDRVRCRNAAGFHIWIEPAQGGVVAVERDWARYIDVEADASPARTRAVTRPGASRSASGGD